MNKFIILMLFFSCGLAYAGGQKEIQEQLREEFLSQCFSEADALEFEENVQEHEADTSMQEKREELLLQCITEADAIHPAADKSMQEKIDEFLSQSEADVQQFKVIRVIIHEKEMEETSEEESIKEDKEVK